ncbi:MAG: polymer-forming cytoskeletal protein [Patescibacteria group bacterium]
MFQKKIQNTIDTIIGPSVKLEGDFNGDGNIIIAGTISGNLKTSGDLKILKTAKINANINANNILISGKIKGNIKALGKIELTSTALVFGDIEAKIISISGGAILNSKCITNIEEKK